MPQIKNVSIVPLSFSQKFNTVLTENNEIQAAFPSYNDVHHKKTQTVIFAFWRVNAYFFTSDFAWGSKLNPSTELALQ